MKCPECGYNEAVVFIDELAATEKGMKLTYVCARKQGGVPCGRSYWDEDLKKEEAEDVDMEDNL